MPETQLNELVRHVQGGQLQPTDTALLEEMPAQDILAYLQSVYRFQIQERRLNAKWERSMALSWGFSLVSVSSFSLVPIGLLVPVFRHCLFVSSEGDGITGIATARRMALKPINKPFKGFAITTAGGFKLDRTPDGWDMKRQEKRKVKLSELVLLKRGWRFDFHWQALAKTESSRRR